MCNMFALAVAVSTHLTTALYHGNFLWDRPNSPNNFCSLLFGNPSPPLASTGAKEAMMLHLKAKKGGGWSDKDLEKACRQVIVIPLTVDAMVHTLHNFAAAAEVFFCQDSLFSVGLRSRYKAISWNLACYESQAAGDPSFIAKVLSAIDTRVNY